MAKRLSSSKLGKLETFIQEIGQANHSAVFGICNMDREVIRSLKMTPDGICVTEEEATILIPERLEKLLYPKRIKIVWGGRGSAKTRTVVSILTESARITTERVACFREIMAAIKDSSYQEIADEVSRKGNSNEFRVLDSEIKVPSTKSRFSFGGLYRNITNIKGYAGATKAWTDEAENVSRASLDVLEPTIRGAGSELWFTFNPREETDPMWADMVAPYWDKAVDGIYEDKDTLIIECNHAHNPWLTEELIITRDKMRRVDTDRYLWIWEGKFRRNSNVKVLNGKWRIDEFTPDKSWGSPLYGADFGFSQDPSTLVRCWVHNSRLYIEYEACKVGVELDDMPAFYESVPEAKRYKIRADCARPETISHIKRHGFNIEGCEKWSGSVEDGIEHLRSYEEIIIHPRCKNAIHEANAYSFKVDRLTGDVLTDIVDKDNHCIAEGELVTTSKGDMPIEEVKAGDFVLTRSGMKEVIDAWQSGENRDILEIKAGDKTLKCTPCHKIFVQGRGFIRADAIRYGDTILMTVERKSWLKQLYTKARNIIATLKVSVEAIGSTLKGQ